VKALIATTEGQGLRKSDFFWGMEGELVMLPITECEFGKVDDDCGCKRAFSGMNTAKGTTTAMVEEVAVSRVSAAEHAMCAVIAARYQQDPGKWLAEFRGMLKGVSEIPVGTIMERRDKKIKIRRGAH